jgi:hypothetical protein
MKASIKTALAKIRLAKEQLYSMGIGDEGEFWDLYDAYVETLTKLGIIIKSVGPAMLGDKGIIASGMVQVGNRRVQTQWRISTTNYSDNPERGPVYWAWAAIPGALYQRGSDPIAPNNLEWIRLVKKADAKLRKTRLRVRILSNIESSYASGE